MTDERKKITDEMVAARRLREKLDFEAWVGVRPEWRKELKGEWTWIWLLNNGKWSNDCEHRNDDDDPVRCKIQLCIPRRNLYTVCTLEGGPDRAIVMPAFHIEKDT